MYQYSWKHECEENCHSITSVRSPVGQVREWTEAWMDLGMLHLLPKDITALVSKGYYCTCLTKILLHLLQKDITALA